MDNYLDQFGVPPVNHPRKSRWAKLVSATLGLVAVAALLVYSGGMESVLKLLGVGASGIYDLSISNTRDWVGGEEAEWIVPGTEPSLDGVSVFDQFGGIPADVNPSALGNGFVAPIFSSPADPASEMYLTHAYTSAVADLTLDAPLLSAIEVVDFAPAGASISYSYRTADDASGIMTAAFQPLDPSVVNSTSESGVEVRTGIIEQTVGRYVQIKFSFANADPLARPAVYAVSFQYKDEADDSVPNSDIGNVDEYTVTVRYAEVNAPTLADIDVLASSNAADRTVYSERQVDLTERLSYTFSGAFTPGAYALVVSAPTIETQIVPFLAGSSSEIVVNLSSFSAPTGQDSGYDLNGDGAVNSIDLQLLLSKFTP